jgi:lincosamide nucleotidyltransferase A/C/D/E
MVRAEDAASIYQSFSANKIRVWLTGGWGIDALLQEQTRPHKDLDIIMLVDDVVPLRDLLGRAGYGLKELWSENTWVVDSQGTEIPTAFVLHDVEGREVDAHAMYLDDHGNGIPAWAREGLVFRPEDLAGEGLIAGVPVRCLSAEMQVRAHTGYELPPEQSRDMELLRERLGVEWPKEHSQPRHSGT